MCLSVEKYLLAKISEKSNSLFIELQLFFVFVISGFGLASLVPVAKRKTWLANTFIVACTRAKYGRSCVRRDSPS